MSFYIDDPIMCPECGYLHKRHAVSCERQKVPPQQCVCERGHDRPYWICPLHGYVVVDV